MFCPEPHKNTQKPKGGNLTFEAKRALLQNLAEEQVVTSIHVTPIYVTLINVTPAHVTSTHVTLINVTIIHVTSIHVTPTDVTQTKDLCDAHSLFQELYLWLVARLEAQHRALLDNQMNDQA